jgi:hypothetical protein
MAYLQSRSPFKQKKDYPVMEKKLDPGVIAEANNDGTIFVSKDASPAVQKHAVKEEIGNQVSLTILTITLSGTVKTILEKTVKYFTVVSGLTRVIIDFLGKKEQNKELMAL